MVVGAGTGPPHLPSVLDLYAHLFSQEGPTRHSSKVDRPPSEVADRPPSKVDRHHRPHVRTTDYTPYKKSQRMACIDTRMLSTTVANLSIDPVAGWVTRGRGVGRLFSIFCLRLTYLKTMYLFGIGSARALFFAIQSLRKTSC